MESRALNLLDCCSTTEEYVKPSKETFVETQHLGVRGDSEFEQSLSFKPTPST